MEEPQQAISYLPPLVTFYDMKENKAVLYPSTTKPQEADFVWHAISWVPTDPNRCNSTAVSGLRALSVHPCGNLEWIRWTRAAY